MNTQASDTIIRHPRSNAGWELGIEMRLLNGGLRRRREEKGLTGKQLAQIIGVSPAYVYQAETLRTKPSPRILRRLADFFDCFPDDIWPPWLVSELRPKVTVYRKIDEIAFSALDADLRKHLYSLPTEGESPETLAERTLLKEQLDEVLKTLTPREQAVMKLRFGLNDGRPHTLEEVGRSLGLAGMRIRGKERVRQVEARALRKLRHPTRAKRLSDFLP